VEKEKQRDMNINERQSRAQDWTQPCYYRELSLYDLPTFSSFYLQPSSLPSYGPFGPSLLFFRAGGLYLLNSCKRSPPRH